MFEFKCSDFQLTKKIDATTFITEGPTIMSPSSVMSFLVRCFLLLVVTMVSQLPGELGAKVDSDSFLASFSFIDSDGARKRVGPWMDGPGWRRSNSPSSASSPIDGMGADLVDQKAHLDSQRRLWTEHQNKCGGHIPSAVCTVADITPLEGWSDGDPLEKIKPLRFGDKKPKVTSSSEMTQGIPQIRSSHQCSLDN